MKRKLLSMAVALFVVGIGGASFAGNSDVTVTVLDYTPTKSGGDLLVQLPGGSKTDLNVDATRTNFSIGVLPQQLPPSPCRSFYRQWNRFAATDSLSSARVTHLLERMALFQCKMNVELPPSPVGPTVLVIRPPTADTAQP